jgi:hypothetical protein
MATIQMDNYRAAINEMTGLLEALKEATVMVENRIAEAEIAGNKEVAGIGVEAVVDTSKDKVKAALGGMIGDTHDCIWNLNEIREIVRMLREGF